MTVNFYFYVLTISVSDQDLQLLTSERQNLLQTELTRMGAGQPTLFT